MQDPDKRPEKNPLEGIADSALGSLIKSFLKVKGLKVNIDFEGFTIELKTKDPPADAKDAPPGAQQ
jgi:hypothetical protein